MMNAMSRWIAGGLSALCLLVALAGALPGTTATAQEPTFWVRDLQQAQRLAAERRCLVLVHFWNYNCPPCVTVDRKVFNQPNVMQSISANFVGVRVNATELPELRRQFNVDRWPVDIILTPDGQEVYRTVSEQDPDRYVATLDRVAAHLRVGKTPPRDTFDRAQPYGTETSPAVADRGPFPNRDVDNSGYASGGPPRSAESAGQVQAETFAGNDRPPANNPRDDRYAAAPPYNPGYGSANEQYQGRPDLYRPREDAPRDNNRPFTPDTNRSATPPGFAAAPPQQPDPRAARSPGWNPAIPNDAARAAVAPPPSAPQSGAPSLGLDGHCPVTLAHGKEWRKGDPRFGAVHRGRTYLFSSEQAKQAFMQAPDRYSPMLSGYDPVKFIEERQLVEGRRKHGIWLGDQMYLFTDEVSLQKFWANRDAYAGIVLQAMREDTSGRIQR